MGDEQTDMLRPWKCTDSQALLGINRHDRRRDEQCERDTIEQRFNFHDTPKPPTQFNLLRLPSEDLSPLSQAEKDRKQSCSVLSFFQGVNRAGTYEGPRSFAQEIR